MPQDTIACFISMTGYSGAMKTRVSSHEGLNIYRVDTRGQTFFKSERIFGEEVAGRTVDDVKRQITAKLAAGDTRVQVETHEGVNIYQITEGGKQYDHQRSGNGRDDPENTIYQVARDHEKARHGRLLIIRLTT